jgi:prepilin-type N-terminal cleavage/methylation domain-containing protein
MRWGVLASEQAGFTLIEILITALIVVLISGAVAQALISSTDFSAHQRFRSQADQVAQQDQERLKAMSDQQLTALDQSRTVTLSNIPFTVRSTATFLDANGGSSCSSGSAAYFKLDSVVTWPEGFRNATGSITEETIVTRTVTGGIIAQVNDQTGTGIPGVLVTANGQNTGENVSGVTDSSGCTLFANLPTDTYTIALAASGYVDKDGNASPPNASVNVTQTAITAPHVALNLGLAGSISTSFATTSNAGTALAAQGREVSYYSSGNGISMTNIDVAGSTSASATPLAIGSLFPFYSPPPIGSSYTNNYQVWAGACQQEQPLKAPTGTDAATVGPGSTGVAATVWEPAVDLAIKYNGTYVAPTDVKLLFTGTSASTGTCTDTWTNVTPIPGVTDAVSGVNYGVYPAPFASNAAKGSATASRTGDPGTLKLCADYKYQASPARYRSETTPTAFTNTSSTSATVVPVMDVFKDGASTATQC